MAGRMRTYYFYELIDENGLVYIGRSFDISKTKYDHFNRFLKPGETSRTNLQLNVLGELVGIRCMANQEEDRLIQSAREKYGEENVVNKPIPYLGRDYICTHCGMKSIHFQTYYFHECNNRLYDLKRLKNLLDTNF